MADLAGRDGKRRPALDGGRESFQAFPYRRVSGIVVAVPAPVVAAAVDEIGFQPVERVDLGPTSLPMTRS